MIARGAALVLVVRGETDLVVEVNLAAKADVLSLGQKARTK